MTEYIFGTDSDEGHWLTGETIVRCRDCKYQRDCYCDHPKGAYMNAILPVEPDGFCKWGERK